MNSLVKHYEDCYLLHGDNHRGVDWPNKEGADVRYKVMLEVENFDNNPVSLGLTSILDYGCGLGHLLEYMIEHDILYNYNGYDISAKFIAACKNKFGGNKFSTKPRGQHDYVIMNGVFTEKLDMTFNKAAEHMQENLKQAWILSARGIAFNVMSPLVDRTRADLFHCPLDYLTKWIADNLSRKFIVRNDYGLWEYTVYVYH